MPKIPGLLLALFLTTPLSALENQLRDHPSPYLAMHGGDPVAWQDWGTAALELARREDKLLLVSSGYFACHWCHVMQRESYRNAAIAALLNRHFVPVKIDRELHSALDTLLIEHVQQTQGQAGWPLNVFLTPEGYPLLGTTYQPPQDFLRLLGRVQENWRQDPERMRDLARGVSLQMRQDVVPRQASTARSSGVLHEALLERAMVLADPVAGGFGEQSKFPMAPQLLALLELQEIAPRPSLAEFLVLTLDAMANGGLRDQLAGGFFRYTIDPGWETPHFEKMLYTQALLSEVYLRAAEILDRADYAAVARDTLQFVIREMPGPQGGYMASFSAVDGTGREGGVYLWTDAQLKAALGEQGSLLARRYWGMEGPAALEAGHMPRRAKDSAQLRAVSGLSKTEFEKRVAVLKARLLTARGRRSLPVDHKELAGWNGLLLAALARAVLVWGDSELRAAADRIHDFLHSQLWDGEKLRRAIADGGTLARATLDDYAYVAYGMTIYAELSGDAADRDFARLLIDRAWQRYHGPGGWRLDDRPLIPGLGERAALPDGALPAPSAVLIRLAVGSGDPALVERAISSAARGRGLVQAAPFEFAGHHLALSAVAGKRSASATARSGAPEAAIAPQ